MTSLRLHRFPRLTWRGCTGCDACRDNIAKLVELGEEAIDDDFAPCVIDDDMQEIYELIDSADEITVVSPVYFAGPPSQLKALLDRLQPYYWTNARVEEKRPAVLHVVGEGGDPHGFSALVSIVRSALAVAGFRLETVFDWVGKIDENGEITAEAEVRSIEDLFAAADSAMTPAQGAEGDGAAIIEFPQMEEPSSSSEEDSAEPGSSRGPRGGARTRAFARRCGWYESAPCEEHVASRRRQEACGRVQQAEGVACGRRLAQSWRCSGQKRRPAGRRANEGRRKER